MPRSQRGTAGGTRSVDARSWTPQVLLLALLLAGSVLLATAPAARAAGAPSAPAPVRSLAGTVLDTTGAPLAGVGVDVYRYASASVPTSGAGAGGERVGSVLTGAEGTWSLDLPEGYYTVFATDRTGQHRTTERDRVPLDQFSASIWLTMPDPADLRTVRGVVLDQTAAPVPGAEVTLYHLYDRGPGAWRYVNEAQSAVSDELGRYTITTPYSSGWVSLSASAPSYDASSLEGHDRVSDDAGLVTTAATTAAPDLTLTASATGAAAPPELTGRAAVGGSLRAVLPDLGPDVDSVDVTWLLDGTLAVSHDSLVYRPGPADLGHLLSVEVVGHRSLAGPMSTVSSAVRVARAPSRTLMRAAHRVGAAGRAVLRIRVRSAAAAPGALVVRDRGRVVARHSSGATGSTRLLVRRLCAGRHVLQTSYTGSRLTAGSRSRAVVVRVARHGR